MNYIRQRQVYFAAKDERFPHLRDLLKEACLDRSLLVNSITESSTPLLAAIKTGYREAVRIIVEECDADIELAGNIELNGEKGVAATPLWAAVTKKDIELVKYLVESSTDVNNLSTASRCTPLWTACCLGEMDIANYLIRKGADPNLGDKNGRTCLMAACGEGHQEIVQILLDKGADVHQKNRYGQTALHFAAQSGHLGLIRLLVANRAKFTRSNDGEVPLLEAVVNEHKHVVEYIVNLGSSMYGTDIEIANDANFTCLMGASLKGNLELVQFLLQCGANVKRKDLDGDSALHANINNANVTAALLARGATMEKDFFGETPLLRAAKWGGVRVVEHIIESNRVNLAKGEEINALDLLGAYMVLKGEYRTSTLFWRKALQRRDDEPVIPVPDVTRHFHVNVYGTSVEIANIQQLDMVLLRGNLADDMGMQALLVTERILGPNHMQTVELLLNQVFRLANKGDFYGCRVFMLQALLGMSNLSYVFRADLKRLARFLVDIDETLQWMTSKHFEKIQCCDVFEVMKITFRVIRTRAISEVNAWPITSTFHANCEKECEKMVTVAMHQISLFHRLSLNCSQQLMAQCYDEIQKFLKLDPRGSGGITPLHTAVFLDRSAKWSLQHFPCITTLEMLLSMGVNVNSVDYNGDTPLHFAVRHAAAKLKLQQHLNPEVQVVKKLLSYGADVNIFNKSGHHPLKPLENQRLVMSVVFPYRYACGNDITKATFSVNCPIYLNKNKIVTVYPNAAAIMFASQANTSLPIPSISCLIRT